MTWVYVLLGLLVASQIAFFYLILRKKEEKQDDAQGFLLLQNQLSRLNENVNANIKEIIEKVVRIDETGKQMVSFADQLQNLQDILHNPKQRGVLGEYYLETVLKNVLPPGMYEMQYEFKDGEIVDAAVFVGEKIIPIDSKFSLENYNRAIEAREKEDRERYERAFKGDLKLRIDETAKYVQPENGTMEFAFMFIPSEGIYYDILVNQVGAMKTNTRDLIEYAFSKKVIIVSPTSFLAYLQTVLQGLKAMQIEKDAEEIRKRVGELGKHLKGYEEYHLKLGNTLGTAVNHYNFASKELGKVDKDVMRITGTAVGVETLTLERPDVE